MAFIRAYKGDAYDTSSYKTIEVDKFADGVTRALDNDRVVNFRYAEKLSKLRPGDGRYYIAEEIFDNPDDFTPRRKYRFGSKRYTGRQMAERLVSFRENMDNSRMQFILDRQGALHEVRDIDGIITTAGLLKKPTLPQARLVHGAEHNQPIESAGPT